MTDALELLRKTGQEFQDGIHLMCLSPSLGLLSSHHLRNQADIGGLWYVVKLLLGTHLLLGKTQLGTCYTKKNPQKQSKTKQNTHM